MKTCPQCGAEHKFQTRLCQKCYYVQWTAKRKPRRCPECGDRRKVFTTENQCSKCYQRVRNKRMVGTCVDCGQFRRIPSSGRCVYCAQRRRRATQPHEQCAQCGRMAPLYSAGVCRPCYTNNVKRKSKYGITPEQYVAMLKDQRGLCAICDEPLKRQPHIDHCHATGQIRSILCYKCNVGLGNFADDPARLRAAAAYIEFHRSRKVA